MIDIPEYIDLIGKPFEYSGRGPDKFDCYGLAVEIYKRAGFTLPDYQSTDIIEAQANGFIHGAEHYFEQVIKPRNLDIILFQIMPKYITHCGIYVGYGRFLHITRKTLVSCEELNNMIWKDKQRGFYRFKELL